MGSLKRVKNCTAYFLPNLLTSTGLLTGHLCLKFINLYRSTSSTLISLPLNYPLPFSRNVQFPIRRITLWCRIPNTNVEDVLYLRIHLTPIWYLPKISSTQPSLKFYQLFIFRGIVVRFSSCVRYTSTVISVISVNCFKSQVILC